LPRSDELAVLTFRLVQHSLALFDLAPMFLYLSLMFLYLPLMCVGLLLMVLDPLPMLIELLTLLVQLLALRIDLVAVSFDLLALLVELALQLFEPPDVGLEIAFPLVELAHHALQILLDALAVGAQLLAFSVELRGGTVALFGERLFELLPDSGGSLSRGLFAFNAQPHRVRNHAPLGLGARCRNFGFQTRRPLGPHGVDTRGPSLFGFRLGRSPRGFQLVVVLRTDGLELRFELLLEAPADGLDGRAECVFAHCRHYRGG
jgi:hypothetical protein